jgi:hypothetical protein
MERGQRSVCSASGSPLIISSSLGPSWWHSLPQVITAFWILIHMFQAFLVFNSVADPVFLSRIPDQKDIGSRMFFTQKIVPKQYQNQSLISL